MFESLVDIALMFEESGVFVIGDIVGFFLEFEGLFEFALFEEDPCEAVEIGGVIAIGIDCEADHFFGLFEIFALVCVEVTEVIIDSGVIRDFAIDFFEDGFAFLDFAALSPDIGESHACESAGFWGEVGDFEDGLVLFGGVIPVFGDDVDACEAHACFDEEIFVAALFEGADGLDEDSFGFVEVTFFGFDECESGEELWFVGNHFECFVDGAFCGVEVVIHAIGDGQSEESIDSSARSEAGLCEELFEDADGEFGFAILELADAVFIEGIEEEFAIWFEFEGGFEEFGLFFEEFEFAGGLSAEPGNGGFEITGAFGIEFEAFGDGCFAEFVECGESIYEGQEFGGSDASAGGAIERGDDGAGIAAGDFDADHSEVSIGFAGGVEDLLVDIGGFVGFTFIEEDLSEEESDFAGLVGGFGEFIESFGEFAAAFGVFEEVAQERECFGAAATGFEVAVEIGFGVGQFVLLEECAGEEEVVFSGDILLEFGHGGEGEDGFFCASGIEEHATGGFEAGAFVFAEVAEFFIGESEFGWFIVGIEDDFEAICGGLELLHLEEDGAADLVDAESVCGFAFQAGAFGGFFDECSGIREPAVAAEEDGEFEASEPVILVHVDGFACRAEGFFDVALAKEHCGESADGDCGLWVCLGGFFKGFGGFAEFAGTEGFLTGHVPCECIFVGGVELVGFVTESAVGGSGFVVLWGRFVEAGCGRMEGGGCGAGCDCSGEEEGEEDEEAGSGCEVGFGDGGCGIGGVMHVDPPCCRPLKVGNLREVRILLAGSRCCRVRFGWLGGLEVGDEFAESSAGGVEASFDGADGALELLAHFQQ